MKKSNWGGARPGAGRKPGPIRMVPHRARPGHRAAHPVHITLRARAGLPSFRESAIFGALRDAIAASAESTILGNSFRILHFSVQTNHLHLIVEATDEAALSRGMRGLGTRLARAIHGALKARGRVWAERYHGRALRNPREVRATLVYVLMNAKKHGARINGIDRFSSAPWFDGFVGVTPSSAPSPTVAPKTALAATAWRKLGLIRLDERPASSEPRT